MTILTNGGPHFLDDVQMGLGASAWGDRVAWQYGRSHTEADIREAFQASVDEGIRFIDTAEVYGSGQSERLLGLFGRESDAPVHIATKFFPWPWRLSRKSVVAALQASLKRIGSDGIDLYQVHWPTPLRSPEALMEGMLDCVEAGLASAVGVSNFNQADMLRAYSMLARHNAPLASNQVHYSLARRDVEKNGLLARCKELGIRLIAYSPSKWEC